jgi:cell division protein FtsB
MAFKSAYKKISIKELVILLVILFCGALYVFYIWIDTKNQNVNQVLQVSSSVVASLPKEELKYLDQKPEELKDDQFLQLKESLQKVIAVNKDARFAYLYIERDNKLYFVVDSEPLNSPDYSPAGQEFTEADPVDKKPFTERKPIITQPVTDRWGTWVSVEIPVINEATGKVVAAFGMDYNSRAWGNRILFEVSESSLLVIIILILALDGCCTSRPCLIPKNCRMSIPPRSRLQTHPRPGLTRFSCSDLPKKLLNGHFAFFRLMPWRRNPACPF